LGVFLSAHLQPVFGVLFFFLAGTGLGEALSDVDGDHPSQEHEIFSKVFLCKYVSFVMAQVSVVLFKLIVISLLEVN
jgi:hypothetical protein